MNHIVNHCMYRPALNLSLTILFFLVLIGFLLINGCGSAVKEVYSIQETDKNRKWQKASKAYRRIEARSYASIHIAPAGDNSEEVKALVVAGADLNAQFNEGGTPLHVAAASGNTEEVKALVVAGADLNAQNNEGETPLHVAVASGNTEAIKVLLDAGADVNARDNSWETPLYTAAMRGDASIAKILFDAGADVDNGFTSFFGLSARENPECREEASVLTFDFESSIKPPLFAAARGGNVDVVKMLVDDCARVGGLYEYGGEAALHFATNAKVVKALIDAGADVNVQDGFFYTPLHLAVNVDVARALIDAGADVGLQTKSGYTPLHLADNADVVKVLLDAGADVNVRSNGQDPYVTPLHQAAEKGDPEIVKVLLDAGADVNARVQDKTKRGSMKTPLHFASEQGNVKVVSALLDAGADVNAKDSDGETPLVRAIRGKHTEVADVLRAAGAY